MAWALLCPIALAVSAQQPQTYGRVADASDKTPIQAANVLVLTPDSTFLTGTTTDADGRFCLPHLPEAGKENLLFVSCIGYKTACLNFPQTDTIQIFLQQSFTELDEVTVRARQVILKDDRRMVMPTAEQARMSTDGLDLLRRIRLPRVNVNPLTGEVGLSGGGNIRLCLNGVQVTSDELSAVSPADVLRIECHDSPGARYENADMVVDYITRRREQGGNVSGDFLDAFGNGFAGLNHLAAKYNHGRSEWSANASYMEVKRNRWTRDYDETRVFPDGEVYRQEIGLPVPIDVRGSRTCLNYSLAEEGKYYLNAQLSYSLNDAPKSEEGDRRNILLTSDSDQASDIYEHLSERSHSPALDLYFQRTLNGGGQLILDAVGTYIKTDSRRIYREGQADASGVEVLSNISGNKYSLIAEGMYEQPWGTHRLTVGARHLQACTDNTYTGNVQADISMHQSESSVYAEYRRKWGRWSYMGNLTATRLYYSQSGIRMKKYTFHPSVRLSFSPNDESFIRYRADFHTDAPSLSALNDVEQKVDAGQVLRGNPCLKAYHTLNQQLTAGYDIPWLSLDVMLGYKHEYHPIMESVFYEEGHFIRTYENQRSFRKLTVESTLTLRPWKEHLSIAFSPGVSRYISRGNNYLHTYTMPRFRWNIDFIWHNWMLSYNTLVGDANRMYGEQIMEEKDMHLLMAGYKQPKWSLKVGVLNPFLKEYWMETQDRSAVLSSVSRAHSDRPVYFAVQLGFRLDYGRQTQGNRKQINHEDTDAGIMQGTK